MIETATTDGARTHEPKHEPGLAGRFLRWCAQAYNAASEAEVIASMDERMISGIARDCSISPQDLVRMARAGPDAADEMLAMMRHLGIDPVEVLLQYPALFRDMQLRCAKCSAKARCRRDLKNNDAGKEFGRYCGNSDSLTAIRDQPGMQIDRT